MESIQSKIEQNLYGYGGLQIFIGFCKDLMAKPQFRFMLRFKLGNKFLAPH